MYCAHVCPRRMSIESVRSIRKRELAVVPAHAVSAGLTGQSDMSSGCTIVSKEPEAHQGTICSTVTRSPILRFRAASAAESPSTTLPTISCPGVMPGSIQRGKFGSPSTPQKLAEPAKVKDGQFGRRVCCGIGFGERTMPGFQI